MKRNALLMVSLAALLAASGCQSAPSRRAALAAAEPSLNTAAEPGATVVAVPPPRSETFVDRHPILNKPREFYESSGNNTAVKIAAATVVGIPAGIVGELKQIVVGQPRATPN